MGINNEETVRGVYASFITGDVDTIMSYLHDDVVWSHPAVGSNIPIAGDYKGKEGVLQFFDDVVNSVDVLGQEVFNVVGAGDLYVALGYEKMRVQSTDKVYGSNWAHVFTFKDGKIIRFEEFIDTYEMDQAFIK